MPLKAFWSKNANAFGAKDKHVLRKKNDLKKIKYCHFSDYPTKEVMIVHDITWFIMCSTRGDAVQRK